MYSMKGYFLLLSLAVSICLITLSPAAANEQMNQTGPGSLAYAISADGLVLIIRTETDNGYREALMNFNGRHSFGTDIRKEDMNKGAMFLLSADFYKDYNDAVNVGKPIVMDKANKTVKIKVFIVTDPYAKNITGESKFITLSELSSVPCEFKNFRYGLSTDNELILVLEEGNTVKVFQDSQGRHALGQKIQIEDISKENYQLVHAERTSSGKIKLGKSVETGRSESKQLSKSNSHQKDQSNLPPYEILLVGSNEVRVKNPNNFGVSVGLRANSQGKDFEVSANGIASVFVPNGAYNIYFVYSDKPDALFQGDDFVLDNNGIEIQIVKVVGGNYKIKQVK